MDERPAVRRQLRRITPQDPVLRIENRLETATGVIWTLWTNKGIEFDLDGRVLEAQSTGIDISDRKAMEQQLRENDERKNQFLATLGHELRNPLAPLRTGLELLNIRANQSGIDDILNMLSRQVRHLTRLVDDLVDVARISRGQVELRRSLVNLNDVIAAAVELSRPLMSEHEHEFEVLGSDESLPVLADFERLTQVISNLLNNAATYTSDKGSITLRTRVSGGEVCLEVSDTGLGFPPSRSETLFDMYARIPEHRGFRSGGGLGVGLPLARQLVELHGGSLTGKSDGTGKGSTFVMRLPIHDAEPGESIADAEASSLDIPEAVATSAARRVLVVDDNLDAANTMVMMLSARDFEVHGVHDGETALQAFRDFAPDVVLLDIGLPDIDGYEVAREIREQENGAHVKLIAVTGWGQAHDRRQATQAGFDAHLTKPAATADLLSLINSYRPDRESR